MNNLCLGDLASIIEGRLQLGAMPPLDGELAPVRGISLDSRQIRPNDVFWGIRGARHDGSRFAEEAFARGAIGAVVEGRRLEPWAGKFSLEVEDSAWALWQLAGWMRRRFSGRLIAVTGGEGRSESCQLIYNVLSQHYVGSQPRLGYDNRIGVALAMLDLDEQNDFGLIPLVANALGEIDSISHLCYPHIAVITRTSDTHLGHIDSLEASAAANCELFRALPDDGWAIIDGDDPYLKKHVSSIRQKVLRIGQGEVCDIRAMDCPCHSGSLIIVVKGQQITIPRMEKPFVTAALAAIAVGQIANVPLDDVAAYLTDVGAASFRPVGRAVPVVDTPWCSEAVQYKLG